MDWVARLFAMFELRTAHPHSKPTTSDLPLIFIVCDLRVLRVQLFFAHTAWSLHLTCYSSCYLIQRLWIDFRLPSRGYSFP